MRVLPEFESLPLRQLLFKKPAIYSGLFCCQHGAETNAKLSELWEKSATTSERQAGACRLPQAMSAGAAQPVPPSFYENDFIISKDLFFSTVQQASTECMQTHASPTSVVNEF